MNKVYLQKYNAICALGAGMSAITHQLGNNKSGLEKQAFQFDTTVEFPVGKFKEEDLQSIPKITASLFERICLHYIKNLIEETAVDFQQKDTLLILATTKGNINALKTDKNAASLHELIPFFKAALHTYNTPIIISTACTSGLVALTQAHDFVKAGLYKNVVVCAADLISTFVVSGFNTFHAISPVNCTPYDENRSGVSLGEACAVALVSTVKSEIEILGGGSSNDANHISGPSRDGSGLSLAIKKAMAQSKTKTFDFINAHGTATNFNDEMECKAFNALQLETTPLNSLKGYFGHTLGAAGLLESILCAEMMKNNKGYKSIGLEKSGLSLPLNVLTENKEIAMNTVLKTASGFGGCNAAIILRKS